MKQRAKDNYHTRSNYLAVRAPRNVCISMLGASYIDNLVPYEILQKP